MGYIFFSVIGLIKQITSKQKVTQVKNNFSQNILEQVYTIVLNWDSLLQQVGELSIAEIYSLLQVRISSLSPIL